MPMYDFECPEGHVFEKNVPIADRDTPIPCEEGCASQATRIEVSFSKSNAILDHGLAANRDAAREGRYDPLNPSRRFIAKGRKWRRSQ